MESERGATQAAFAMSTVDTGNELSASWDALEDVYGGEAFLAPVEDDPSGNSDIHQPSIELRAGGESSRSGLPDGSSQPSLSPESSQIQQMLTSQIPEQPQPPIQQPSQPAAFGTEEAARPSQLPPPATPPLPRLPPPHVSVNIPTRIFSGASDNAGKIGDSRWLLEGWVSWLRQVVFFPLRSDFWPSLRRRIIVPWSTCLKTAAQLCLRLAGGESDGSADRCGRQTSALPLDEDRPSAFLTHPSDATVVDAGSGANEGDVNSLQKEVELLREALEKEKKDRQAERKGRIKAQKELRDVLVAPRDRPGAFPVVPIGYLKSCFTTRNGTPRQPLLVPAARAQLKLRSGKDGVPHSAFDGLDRFSHCWVLYIFHVNTNLQHMWDDSRAWLKAKVKVPRLNGERVGVLATRTPHRPVPVGLSLAKVEKVADGVLYLSGVDIVNGSPIIDIKPYLPYSDSLPGAAIPEWINVEGDSENDPMRITSVTLTPEAEQQLDACWPQVADISLYDTKGEYRELMIQVLSRDIRATRHRKGHKLVWDDQTSSSTPLEDTDAGTSSERGAQGFQGQEADDVDGDGRTKVALASKLPSVYNLVLERLVVSYVFTTITDVLVQAIKVATDDQMQVS